MKQIENGTKFQRPVLHRQKSGFTLTELLAVTAIMAVLMTGVANLTSGVGGDNHKKSLIEIANAFESARQTAVSRNTYVYVAFTTPASKQNRNDPLCLATFESVSGADVLQNAVALADTSKWRLIGRPAWLRQTEVADSTVPPSGLVPSDEMNELGSFSGTIRPLSANAFSITRKIGEMTAEASLRFDRVVTFSPNGTALVDNARGLPSSLIGFLVTPCKGEAPSALESARTAAVTIGGFLGNVRFYQR